jgi:hypothetical protein
VSRSPDDQVMQTTYAVVWREGEQAAASGKLELRTTRLVLEGGNGALRRLEVPYAELSSVHVGRNADERLDGRPTLVLERREAEAIRLSSVAQPGIVSELAERLVQVFLGARSNTTLAVVLPIREDARKQALALLAAGPPFDPSRVGLDRHDVFVTERELVFLFEAVEGTATLERLLSRPELWRAALSWRSVIAGPPRVAELGYSWAGAQSANGVSFTATPGPGDSDGGDVFGPNS